MEPTTKRDIIQRSDIRSQKLFASASILDEICGFEQTGNDGDTARAGSEDLFEVLELYSADAKDRQRDRDMRAVDLLQTDYLIIWFGGRCKNRAEPDVIGAFALCCECLLKAVRRFSNQQSSSRLFAGHSNRIIILTNVYAFERNTLGDQRVIVYDQRYLGATCNRMQFGRDLCQLLQRLCFPAKLNQVHSTCDHVVEYTAPI